MRALGVRVGFMCNEPTGRPIVSARRIASVFTVSPTNECIVGRKFSTALNLFLQRVVQSAVNHRQVQALFFGAINRDLIARIRVTHDAGGRVVVQYAGDASRRFIGAVADNHHA
jgi:hypothetical protein